MGVCINCIYHVTNGSGEIVRKKRCGRIGMNANSGHYCSNENNKIVDFVTGEVETPDCYNLNRFEECIYFVDSGATSDEKIPYEEETSEDDDNSETEVTP